MSTAIDINNLRVYRIVHIQNLSHVLENGLFSKNNAPTDRHYVNIGNKEIIDERDKRTVPCFPRTVVNDYVPFYFSVRTPMLFNIHTGRVTPEIQQEDIIYLCCKFNTLATENFQWCFTDGNAAKKITQFYNNVKDISCLDWKSIKTKDFRYNNDDGDTDRVRKKHAEFLVKDHVPPEYIKAIVVLNDVKQQKVEKVLTQLRLKFSIYVNPKGEFYF